jgi:hypothetical protein
MAKGHGRGFLFGNIAALAIVPATAAPAQEIDADPAFWAEAGVYLPDVETEIGLFEPMRTRGTLITLEKELGFDRDTTSLDLTIGAKIDNEFFTEVSVYSLARKTSLELEETIEIENVTYPVGASVRSEFSTDVYRWSLGYRIHADETWDLSALLGAHVTDFKFTLTGEAIVGPDRLRSVESGRTVLAPLPTIGVQAKYRPAKWLELRARADAFKLAIGDYEGRLINLEASVTGAITDHLAAGVAWRSTDYRVRVDDDDFAANLDYGFDGFRLFARLTL